MNFFRIQYERINHFLKFLRVLRVLRSFRALRVLRTIRFIQPIHKIIKTCSILILLTNELNILCYGNTNPFYAF